MNVLEWYIQIGVPGVWRLAWRLVSFVYRYFSIGQLLTTLFAPWKKEVSAKERGLAGGWWEEWSYGLVSRIVGLMVRGATIVAGSVIVVLTLVSVAMIAIFVTVVPVPLVPFYVRFASQSRKYGKQDLVEDLVDQVKTSRFLGFVCHRLGVKLEDLAVDLKKAKLDKDSLWQNGVGADLDKFEIGLVSKLVKTSSPARNRLEQIGVGLAEIGQLGWWFEHLLLKDKRQRAFWTQEYLAGITEVGSQWTYGYTFNLDKYCQDLSRFNLKPLSFVGRDWELERLVEVLSKKAHPNVVLHGRPGVGRRTLLYGLAQAIQFGQFPELSDRRLLLFDAREFLSQTTSRQAPQEWFKLISEAERAGNVVLVIPEFGTLLSSKSGSELSKLFEAHLATDRLQIVAIDSTDDFYQTIEPNKSVMKHFSEYELLPMDQGASVKVLMDYALDLEERSKVYFAYQTIEYLVEVSERLIVGGVLPTKAKNLMDEVAAHAVKSKASRIEKVQVDEVVSRITKTPVGSLLSGESELLLTLEEVLAGEIVEQERAIEQVAKALRRSRVGVGRREKPMGSFLFLGPTGVGKTHTAKILARHFFGTDEFIRFDMAEYQTHDGLERLIGSAHEKIPGRLSQEIANAPYNVLLLDEFEKAPTEIHNLFLRILDEGWFTNALGERVDCRHLMIVATSNAGSGKLSELLESASAEEVDRQMVEYLISEKLFSPELLNRFDGVVVYEPLSSEGLRRVVRMILSQLQTQMYETKKVEVIFGETVVERVLTEGYEPAFGARSLWRYVQNTIADEVAREILTNPQVKRIEF